MTNRSATRQNGIAFLLGVLFLALLCYLMFHREAERINQVFVVLLMGLGLELLAFRKQFLMGLCFLLIPMSMQIDILNSGARFALPTEVIALILGGWFLVRSFGAQKLNPKILWHPLSLLLLIDFVWMLLTSTFSTMPDVSFKRLALRFLVLVFFYLMVAHWLEKDRNKPRPMLLYAIGLAPVVYLTLVKHARFNFIPQVTFTICQPYYSDHTIYGAALAFVLPMLILFWWHWRTFRINFSNRFLLGGLTILIFIGELMAFSRAAWLSLVAVGFLALLMRFKVRPAFILGMVVLASIVLFLFQEPIMMRMQQNESISNKGDVTEHIGSVTNLESDASNLERLNRWFCAWQMFLDKPIHGFGPGTYQFQYGPYQTSTSKTYISTNYGDRGNAHSEYLTYLSEQGLPGILIFIVWVCYTVAMGMRLVYQTRDPVARYLAFGALLGLSTFFFHGLFNTFIDQDKMAGLVFPAMALLVVLDIRLRTEHQKSQTPLSGPDLPLQ